MTIIGLYAVNDREDAEDATVARFWSQISTFVPTGHEWISSSTATGPISPRAKATSENGQPTLSMLDRFAHHRLAHTSNVNRSYEAPASHRSLLYFRHDAKYIGQSQCSTLQVSYPKRTRGG